jgi:hypothetical protein
VCHSETKGSYLCLKKQAPSSLLDPVVFSLGRHIALNREKLSFPISSIMAEPFLKEKSMASFQKGKSIMMRIYAAVQDSRPRTGRSGRGNPARTPYPVAALRALQMPPVAAPPELAERIDSTRSESQWTTPPPPGGRGAQARRAKKSARSRTHDPDRANTDSHTRGDSSLSGCVSRATAGTEVRLAVEHATAPVRTMILTRAIDSSLDKACQGLD